jgi:fatty-acyl-CoA synthase
MQGLMQDWPLTVNRFLEHAARWHGSREIATRRDDGRIDRTTYAAAHRGALRISNALLACGVRPGDRIATLAMNSAEHFEAWYAAAGIGAVCHTLNPRMSVEQLQYIVRHAGDRLLFADGAFAPLVAALLGARGEIAQVVFLSPPAPAVPLPVPHLLLEEFRRDQDATCTWGSFPESTAAGLCYTSGTTGNPKGVLYSHRSNFLHTLMVLQADVFGITARDVVMPVVPLYHANAWGTVFAAPAAGAELIMPGAKLDGQTIYDTMERTGVTLAAGVPSVWMPLLEHVESRGLRFATLRRVLVGGAACPERMLRQFAALGIEVVHAWGMTEMSPVGSTGTLTARMASLPFEAQVKTRIKQGRPQCGVDMKLTDGEGRTLAHDGRAVGHLWVRGDAVVSEYYGDPRSLLDADGFFDTGDIASIDAEGYMHIADRAKDIIKSGGEWISSQDIENVALLHPAVAAASVIGVPHPRWGERPLLLVVLKADAPGAPPLLEFLRERLLKWHVPDEVKVVSEFPLGATGKIDKRRLRAIHAG